MIRTHMTRSALVLAGLLACAPAAMAATSSLAPALERAAPDADVRMLTLAAQSLECALRLHPEATPSRLAVIDYTLPSTKPRLWVFDLKTRQLLLRELVAHGQGTGDNFSKHFSNKDGSHQSSLGMYRTSETYTGRNGYSLRLDGLEPGFNDHARDRAIVMHGAAYVSESTIEQLGRLGRSWGCPAVSEKVARTVIDDIKEGQYLFAYYPDPEWLAHSALFSCPADGNPARQVTRDGRASTARSAHESAR